MKYTEERRIHWHNLVENHAESGLSGAVFCKEQGLNPQRFYSWRRRFRGDSPGPGFIRLVPTAKTPYSGIRIVMEHGMSVELDRGFDPLTLREAIDAFCDRG